ncbi:MAG: hypothetical protein LBG73_05110 [Spirochaetaceae bacterium]|jgi:hypothetical protein|nr:hypothetical protein [Spirochaetaceae bacterium]
MDNEQELTAIFRELTGENQERLLREARRSLTGENPGKNRSNGQPAELKRSASAVLIPAIRAR